MKVHIKVKLTEIHSLDWNKDFRRFVFEQVFDNDDDYVFLMSTNKIDNDIKILVTDPDIAKEFKLGECYYLDFITSDVNDE